MVVLPWSTSGLVSVCHLVRSRLLGEQTSEMSSPATLKKHALCCRRLALWSVSVVPHSKMPRQTDRINMGNDANVADALDSRFMMGVVTRITPYSSRPPGQLGVFQRQQTRQGTPAIVAIAAVAKGSTGEHPQVLVKSDSDTDKTTSVRGCRCQLIPHVKLEGWGIDSTNIQQHPKLLDEDEQSQNGRRCSIFHTSSNGPCFPARDWDLRTWRQEASRAAVPPSTVVMMRSTTASRTIQHQGTPPQPLQFATANN